MPWGSVPKKTSPGGYKSLQSGRCASADTSQMLSWPISPEGTARHQEGVTRYTGQGLEKIRSAAGNRGQFGPWGRYGNPR